MGLYLKSIAFFVIVLIALILCFIFKKHFKYIIVFLLFFTLFYSYIAITENAYEKRYEANSQLKKKGNEKEER